MDKIEVTQWRKKPVVVEAMKYPGHTVTGVDTLLAFEDWIEPLAKAAGRWPLTYRGQSLIIPTLEGDHEAKPGDYIIRGVSGEIYPCKPDIFAKTYEPALATRTDATPVAYLYERQHDGHKESSVDRLDVSPRLYTETPLVPATHVAALVEVLQAIVNQSRLGDGSRPVTFSKRVNYPAGLLFAAQAALAPFTKGQP